MKNKELDIIPPKICTGINFKVMKDGGVVFTPFYEEEEMKIALDSFRIENTQLCSIVSIINKILEERG